MQHLLDVSELEPCEPLERTLQAVGKLAAGDRLKVIHRREPSLLFPLLEKLGCSWRVERIAEARYEILIWRDSDGPPGSDGPGSDAHAC